MSATFKMRKRRQRGRFVFNNQLPWLSGLWMRLLRCLVLPSSHKNPTEGAVWLIQHQAIKPELDGFQCLHHSISSSSRRRGAYTIGSLLWYIVQRAATPHRVCNPRYYLCYFCYSLCYVIFALSSHHIWYPC